MVTGKLNYYLALCARCVHSVRALCRNTPVDSHFMPQFWQTSTVATVFHAVQCSCMVMVLFLTPYTPWGTVTWQPLSGG